MVAENNLSATIYTDGSCHTQHRLGGWAAIIFVGEKKIVLSGIETNTTHNRMELLAVINAINWLKKNELSIQKFYIISDSQYVIELKNRKEKLSVKSFETNAGMAIQNVDLVKELLHLEENNEVFFEKIKAHQSKKDTANFNIEVDKLVRKLVRTAVEKLR